VGDYLLGKDGFLLVSHDRAFLNRCVTHVLSINRKDITVTKGNYDTFWQEMERQNQYELGENERLKKDIQRLNESARRTAQWSQTIEKSKIAGEYSGNSPDRGYIGARSADMMKRALSTQRRKERAAEEKSKLLKNVEKVGELKLSPLTHPKKILVQVRNGQVQYDDKVVCRDISFALRQGERLALSGKNGAGKSSVLQTICGLGAALTGEISIASNLVISYVPQSTEGLRGDFRGFLAESRLDETLFKAILRNMDFGREQFDKDLSELSQGQKKKMLLAKSLCEPAHLYVWDEPLNFIDVLSRVQVEELLLEYKPTMLLVEHDRAFLEKVCTGIVEL
jgi:lincosamide and streptogramin A transport system ATP-binding/permease protein